MLVYTTVLYKYIKSSSNDSIICPLMRIREAKYIRISIITLFIQPMKIVISLIRPKHLFCEKFQDSKEVIRSSRRQTTLLAKENKNKQTGNKTLNRNTNSTINGERTLVHRKVLSHQWRLRLITLSRESDDMS